MVDLFLQRSKAEVRISYYRDKEEHMRKEENCNTSRGSERSGILVDI